MKKSKMIGAAALSAALALGTAVPAFAVDEYGTSTDEITDDQRTEDHKQNDSIATDVHVATMITNINVAVPLNVTIVADSAGGAVLKPSGGLKHYDAAGAFVADGTTGYRIENYSSYPVKIDGVKVEENENGYWKIVGTIDDANVSGTIGDLDLTLSPIAANNKKDDATGAIQVTKNEGNVAADKADEVVALEDALTAAALPGWIIDRMAPGTTEPSIMGLLIDGTSSKLKNVNQNSVLLAGPDGPEDEDRFMPDDAFKIIYTVAAASTAAPAATPEP